VRNEYKILVGEGKRPLGRPKRRSEDNIKVYQKEVGLEGVDWIYLVQGRDRWRALVNMIMNLWGSIKCVEFIE
jgi:hypothetical protein